MTLPGFLVYAFFGFATRSFTRLSDHQTTDSSGKLFYRYVVGLVGVWLHVGA